MRLLNGQKCSYLVPFFLSFFPFFFFFFARHVASLFFFFFSFLFFFSFFSWKSGRCFFYLFIINNFLISWGCGYGWACYQFFFSFFLFFSFLDLAFFPPLCDSCFVLFCFFGLIRHDFFWNMIFIF